MAHIFSGSALQHRRSCDDYLRSSPHPCGARQKSDQLRAMADLRRLTASEREEILCAPEWDGFVEGRGARGPGGQDGAHDAGRAAVRHGSRDDLVRVSGIAHTGSRQSQLEGPWQSRHRHL